MSRKYKNVKNGKGTNLTIAPGKYISVGFKGTDVTIRGNGKVLAFDNWNDFVDAINQEKSAYHNCDYPEGGKIGECEVDENGEIVKLEREYFRQGYIYKNPNAYHNDKSAVCYVPELSDSAYTGQDFLDMCNDQPEIADHVFDAVDWQHPESYLDEQGDDELWQCKCGKWYWCYGVDKCPHCGAEKKEENYAG